MRRRSFLEKAGLLSVSPLVPARILTHPITIAPSPIPAREIWVNYLVKLADPVLTTLAANRLKLLMPVETINAANIKDRAKYTHLEAFARLLCGIAPWLQAEELSASEKQLQDKYFRLAITCIGNAVTEGTADYMNWGDEGGQPVVDASFFAYALVRCPKLWQNLDQTIQQRVITCLKKTRNIKLPQNNWLLFAAMIEAFFISVNEPFDDDRISYAISKHEEWYKGDGMYGDGAEFHWDYYNSFVIQPYLYDVLKIAAAKNVKYELSRKQALQHHLRYAIIQERLIAADGTYPPIGRSITYRTGAFHHLANMALNHQLPARLSPAQVRCALTAVINKVTAPTGMFNDKGWLQIGLYGHQPNLAEGYISTGSLYLCSAILLPLGLPESDPFWLSPDEEWSAKKEWSGMDMIADHSD